MACTSRLGGCMACLLLLSACNGGGSGGAVAQVDSNLDVALVEPFPRLPALSRPVAMYQAPGDDSHWYLVQQTGQVLRFDNTADATALTRLIDIQDRISGGSDERGLLGLAFHPDFQSNGVVYLSYTGDDGSGLVSRISRFVLAQDGQSLDPASEQVVLSVAQPYTNHNGGQIAFGPDGYLYIGLGDGGNAGDPFGHGQNTFTLLGSILRIDVGDGSSADYAIPPDNPFSNGGGAPEIHAYGLRNPWRWSFDRVSGDLWLGDVGQNSFEEVDRILAGGNYGWNIMEGKHCFRPATGCDQSGLIEPLAEYDHSEGVSVTGGYVYRGAAMPGLGGSYLFADFGSGKLWRLQETPPGSFAVSELLDTELLISAFAEDHDGELYLLNLRGSIHKLVPVAP